MKFCRFVAFAFIGPLGWALWAFDQMTEPLLREDYGRPRRTAKRNQPDSSGGDSDEHSGGTERVQPLKKPETFQEALEDLHWSLWEFRGAVLTTIEERLDELIYGAIGLVLLIFGLWLHLSLN